MTGEKLGVTLDVAGEPVSFLIRMKRSYGLCLGRSLGTQFL